MVEKVPLAAAPLTASAQHSREPPWRIVRQRNRAPAKGADASASGARLCGRARRFRAAAPLQAGPSNRASTSGHSEMATTTSTASTASLSNAADFDGGSRTNRGSAVALRKRTVGSQRGAAVIGSEESDRGASAVRVGHLVRAGPPRAARALVESRLRGGEDGGKHG
eukprot:scaffold70436_cov48-Phaeocystis_antarctica.AAC.1